MGRGRAKAKQTKVARDLKYRQQDTDFASLARELHGEPGAPAERVDVVDDEDDEWSSYRSARSD